MSHSGQRKPWRWCFWRRKRHAVSVARSHEGFWWTGYGESGEWQEWHEPRDSRDDSEAQS